MSLDLDVFMVDPKPIPSAVPGFEQAAGPATWPPSTSTLIWADDEVLLVDCLITNSSAVHVPDLSLVVAGDVVYNQTHMWLAGSTPESRASWARALEAVDALGAGTLIAGHRSPQAADDDTRRRAHECRRYPFTRSTSSNGTGCSR